MAHQMPEGSCFRKKNTAVTPRKSYSQEASKVGQRVLQIRTHRACARIEYAQELTDRDRNRSESKRLVCGSAMM